MSDQPLTILAVASYYKGDRFLRRAHARGARVYLLTVESLLKEPWPRECLADVFAQRDDPTVPGAVHHVEVDADDIGLSMTSRNRPSPTNPRTSRMVAPSLMAALRARVDPVQVGR